jgi:hypothetical protein
MASQKGMHSARDLDCWKDQRMALKKATRRVGRWAPCLDLQKDQCLVGCLDSWMVYSSGRMTAHGSVRLLALSRARLMGVQMVVQRGFRTVYYWDHPTA